MITMTIPWAIVLGLALIALGAVTVYRAGLELEDRRDVAEQDQLAELDRAPGVIAPPTSRQHRGRWIAPRGGWTPRAQITALINGPIPAQRVTNGEDVLGRAALPIPESMCQECGRGELIEVDGWISCNYCPANGWSA